MIRLTRGLLVLSCALAASVVHAGLFDDDEARRAILDLRKSVEDTRTKQAENAAELAKANAQLAEQVQQMRRSLLELNEQIESLRGELARLRGTDEQLARDIAEVQRRQNDIAQAQKDIAQTQKDITQGVDDRIKRLEPVQVSVDGRTFMVDPDEKRQFEEALGLLRVSDFAKASSAFSTFVRRHPGSGYVDSARFWLGNALYGQREYKEAIAVFRALVTNAPDHARAPEALLAIANCQAESRNTKAARAAIAELIKAYPKSEAAQAGRERLASLK